MCAHGVLARCASHFSFPPFTNLVSFGFTLLVPSISPSLSLFFSPAACSDDARRYTYWARVLVVAQIMWTSVAQTAMALPGRRSVGMSTSLREEGESRLVGAASAGEARLLVVVQGTSAAELAPFLANIALALVDIHVEPASYACALVFPSSLSLFLSFPSPPFRYSRAYGLILLDRSASGPKSLRGVEGCPELSRCVLLSFSLSVLRMPSGVVCDERQFGYDERGGSSHISGVWDVDRCRSSLPALHLPPPSPSSSLGANSSSGVPQDPPLHPSSHMPNSVTACAAQCFLTRGRCLLALTAFFPRSPRPSFPSFVSRGGCGGRERRVRGCVGAGYVQVRRGRGRGCGRALDVDPSSPRWRRCGGHGVRGQRDAASQLPLSSFSLDDYRSAPPGDLLFFFSPPQRRPSCPLPLPRPRAALSVGGIGRGRFFLRESCPRRSGCGCGVHAASCCCVGPSAGTYVIRGGTSTSAASLGRRGQLAEEMDAARVLAREMDAAGCRRRAFRPDREECVGVAGRV
jgi:hypothetical protein